MKWVVENSPYDIWVQSGSVIKKDDEYLKSLIDEDLHPVTFKYDIWYRGYIKHPKHPRRGHKDAIIDSNGKTQFDWVVGDVYPDKYNLMDYDELDMKSVVKEIDGEEFKPYLMKFRIISGDRNYLEDTRPLDWPLQKSSRKI